MSAREDELEGEGPEWVPRPADALVEPMFAGLGVPGAEAPAGPASQGALSAGLSASRPEAAVEPAAATPGGRQGFLARLARLLGLARRAR
jgi:hypothetical protein